MRLVSVLRVQSLNREVALILRKVSSFVFYRRDRFVFQNFVFRAKNLLKKETLQFLSPPPPPRSKRAISSRISAASGITCILASKSRNAKYYMALRHNRERVISLLFTFSIRVAGTRVERLK